MFSLEALFGFISGRCHRSASVHPSVGETLLLLSRLQYLEGTHESVVHTHHGTGVVELAAVVGSTEQSDELPLGEEFVAVLHDLVRAADQVEVVLLEEHANDLWTEHEGDSSVVLAPALHILVRVRPKQVAQQTGVGHVRRPHDPSNLLHRRQLRR